MEQKLTKAEVHELLDRAYMIKENIEIFLLDHSNMEDVSLKEVQIKIDNAHGLLEEAYQDLGAIMGEF